MTHVTLIGVKIHCMTMETAVNAGLKLLEENCPHWCFTPNPKLLTQAARDEALREILNRADLSLADGVGVVLAARFTGQGGIPRCPGADYALALARAAGERQKRIFLLGGAPGVAEAAGRSLTARCPGLTLAGTLDGYSSDLSLAAARIRATGADLVFVCLGCPAQEKWIARYGGETGAKLLLGLGGTLDVLANRVRRAPALWRRFGLEWLWRGICQPRRLLEWWRMPLFLHLALTGPKEEDACGRKIDRP
ncbi:MAG: WecB/TagA/CpsF family glycosyltransferase [Candidatus Onthomonas sp.]